MPNLIHWVEKVFGWILQTTWQAAILAGLILAAQRLLRKRLAPGWRYGLWLLLIARLLMPVVPPSGFSIFNLARINPTHSRVDVWQPTQAVDSTSRPPVNNLVATPSTDLSPTKEFPRDRASSGIDWSGIACGAWLLGVLLLASHLVWTNVRFRSRIKQHQPIADEDVIRLFDQCRKEFKITKPVRIIESAGVESPGVYGIWQKWLLLPEGVFQEFSREELRHTFLHELAHLKRRDLEVNWVTSFLLILHWFNPVLWLAFARMRADREMATDALALAHVRSTDNVGYGETIIKVAANLGRHGMQPGLVGIVEGKAGLQERLRAIAGAGVAKYWTWAAAGIVAILGGAGLTGAQETDQPEAAGTPRNSASVLNHAAAISGRVVDAHGRPVNHAQVAIYRLSQRSWLDGSSLPASSGFNLTCAPTPLIFNPDFGHPMAELRQASEPWSFCTTDVHGRFYLNDLNRALGLVAVQENGFALIATNGFSNNMTVKLQPWGRIEGTLRHYKKTIPNEPIRVLFAYQEGIPSWGFGSEFNTKTDDHGRFFFNFVPGGHFGVNSAGMIGERVTVKSGQTAAVELGGSGRTVIGKLKIRNGDGEIEAADKFSYAFFTSRADLKVTEEDFKALRRILAFSGSPGKLTRQSFYLNTVEDVAEDLNHLNRALSGQQPDWENTFTNFHIRPVQCAKDGSFLIDQVEPGRYALVVEPSSMAKQLRQQWLTGGHEVEIPAREPKATPLDLGVIEITLRSPSP